MLSTAFLGEYYLEPDVQVVVRETLESHHQHNQVSLCKLASISMLSVEVHQ